MGTRVCTRVISSVVFAPNRRKKRGSSQLLVPLVLLLIRTYARPVTNFSEKKGFLDNMTPTGSEIRSSLPRVVLRSRMRGWTVRMGHVFLDGRGLLSSFQE